MSVRFASLRAILAGASSGNMIMCPSHLVNSFYTDILKRHWRDGVAGSDVFSGIGL